MREIAMTKCTNCDRPVTVTPDRDWMCVSCGHGTFRPIPSSKIRWLREDEARLALGLGGNSSRFGDMEFVLSREVS